MHSTAFVLCYESGSAFSNFKAVVLSTRKRFQDLLRLRVIHNRLSFQMAIDRLDLLDLLS